MKIISISLFEYDELSDQAQRRAFREYAATCHEALHPGIIEGHLRDLGAVFDEHGGRVREWYLNAPGIHPILHRLLLAGWMPAEYLDAIEAGDFDRMVQYHPLRHFDDDEADDAFTDTMYNVLESAGLWKTPPARTLRIAVDGVRTPPYEGAEAYVMKGGVCGVRYTDGRIDWLGKPHRAFGDSSVTVLV